jgi:hypothetical protein
MYLVCRFEGFEDLRNLAMHRIHQASRTGHAFDYPRDFDLSRYDADGHFAFGNGEQVRLSFWIKKSAGRHLLDAKLSADQQVSEQVTSTSLRPPWWTPPCWTGGSMALDLTCGRSANSTLMPDLTCPKCPTGH